MVEEASQDQAQVLLRSRRFRVEREADWRKLEELLERVTKGSAKDLSNEELVALPRVYRSTLSSLSVARATSLDQDMIAYLESLCTRSYFFLYGTRSTWGERIASFFLRDWPRAVSGVWRETLAAAMITIIAGLAAYFLTLSDPDWFYSFIPETLSGGRSPATSTEALRDTLYHDEGSAGLSVFATSLFAHNSSVAIFAFVLGFAFAVPTVLLLAYNGCILGAFVALFVSRGLGFELGGWLLIHGVTELFAIILAGAAGMRIGLMVAMPGSKSRLGAAAEAGRSGALVLGGVIVMLLIAGLLEGFGRQLITSDLTRYAIASATGVIWFLYFYRFGMSESQSE